METTGTDFFEDCEKSLQDYKDRMEVICPVWSEWSDCSKTCYGIKTRIDRCQDDNEQVKACNQESTCPRSGNFLKPRIFSTLTQKQLILSIT